MFRFLKIIFKLFLALFAGLCLAVIILQEDPWFKSKIEKQMIDMLEPYVKNSCDIKLQKINLFTGRLEFSSLKTKSENDDWSFDCPVFTIDFSWLSYFLKSKINADITFYYTNIKSEVVDGNLVIYKPIKALLDAPSELPIVVRNLSFRNLSLNAYEKTNLINSTILFSCDTYIGDVLDTNFSFIDGVIEYKGIPYVKKINGNAQLISKFDSLPDYNFKSHLIGDFSILDSNYQKGNILFDYKNGFGFGQFYTDDNLLEVNFNKVEYIKNNLEIDYNAKTNSSKIDTFGFNKLVNPSIKDIKYDLCLAGKLVLSRDNVLHNSNFVIDNLKYQDYEIKKMEINSKGDIHLSNASFSIQDFHGADLGGNLSLDLNKSIILTNFYLKNQLELYSLKLKTGVFKTKFNLKTNELESDYRIKVDHQKNSYNINGKLNYSQNNIKTNGLLDSYKFNIELMPLPFILKSFSLNYGLINLINLEKLKNSQENISGVVDYQFVKDLINKYLGYNVQGEAKIELNGKVKDKNLNFNVNLKDANIRLGATSNIIKSLKANIEFDLNTLITKIKNTEIELHKGKLNSLFSTINFSGSGEILYAHIPFNFHNCLISWQKDFFGLISGLLTLNYSKEQQSILNGHLILEKSHLRGNILSSDLQKKLFGSSVKSLNSYNKNINLDIKFETKNNVGIKTTLLNTKAKVNLDLKGTLLSPEFSGDVQLIGGYFDLPYKPLYIQNGKIYIYANQLYDPNIELIAKNKIKKYNITMSIRGSLEKPKITFESSPNLQEQQIITLLLSGSEEGSLYLLMPNIMLQNIESLILGSDAKATKLQRYLKKLLKPLKNIRLVPGQSSDDGKSGMQGAIEFDINDRMRAKIQNKLDLSDETELELEYNISDDITIKATKDQKGGVGSELEMRWKF